MDDIINYVMNTPGNTNPNVLKGLLNKMGGSGSGYTVEETRTIIIPEQTVTTVDNDGVAIAALTLADGITEYPKAGDTLSITINGDMKQVVGVYDESFDGAIFVFSGDVTDPGDDPVLAVGVGIDSSMIYAFPPYPATYTISAELVTRTMTVSPEFQEAVAKSTEPLVLTLVPSDPSAPFSGTVTGATAAEIKEAWYSGRVITAVYSKIEFRPYALSDGETMEIFGLIIYDNTGMEKPLAQVVINVDYLTFEAEFFRGLYPMGD